VPQDENLHFRIAYNSKWKEFENDLST
jgi:hypothetical protein